MRDHGGSEWAPLQLANTAPRPSAYALLRCRTQLFPSLSSSWSVTSEDPSLPLLFPHAGLPSLMIGGLTPLYSYSSCNPLSVSWPGPRFGTLTREYLF
eukprot:COSAG02_NODE_133_length_34692_cov_83.845229_8_plen_98_part_00